MNDAKFASAAFADVLKDPEVREKYAKAGFVPVGNRPDEFAAQYKADYQPCRSTTLKWVVQGGAVGDSWSPMSLSRTRNAASSERATAR